MIGVQLSRSAMRAWALAGGGFLLTSLLAAAAAAVEPVLPQNRGIDIEEHLGAAIPLDATFTDEAGKPVQLKSFFQGDRPVILALVYYTCPSLCNLTLNGMKVGFEDLSLKLGKDYQVVTISINPSETAELAAAKKQTYVEDIDQPGAAAGWRWLVGQKAEIDRVADAVGFRYRYDAADKQYLHASAIYAISPTGKISRYLYGIAFQPKDLKLALVEASEGKVGSTLDRLILYCHRYDAVTHRYTLAAMNVMRLGGVVTMLLLGGTLLVLWRREQRAAALAASPRPAPPAGAARPPEPKPLEH